MEIASIGAECPCQSVGEHDLVRQAIVFHACDLIVQTSAVNFRTGATMDKPLLIPSTCEGQITGFGNEVQNIWTTEGHEAPLIAWTGIEIPDIKAAWDR